MKRTIKKTIAFIVFLIISTSCFTPVVDGVAATKKKYTLKVLAANEYSDAVRFGKGYLMLKNGKFNSINPKTEYYYIDEKGNKRQIKNTSGFTKVYLNTSGDTYYVDYSVLAVGKNGKVGLMDEKGILYGGNNNYYECVVHAGDGLFYTTDATAGIKDKANTTKWTLRKKDGSIVKEFNKLSIKPGEDFQDPGTRIYANGYEYINHVENGEAELIAVDKLGKIKVLGKGYTSFAVNTNSDYVVGYKRNKETNTNFATVFDLTGKKLFDINDCKMIDFNDLDKYGVARVTLSKRINNNDIYSENLVNLNGKLVFDDWKYDYIKSYDNKMALVMTDEGDIYLSDYLKNVKFDGKKFASKFGQSYSPVTFCSYYVDSTITVTVKDNKNSNDQGKTFIFDNNMKELAANVTGYVAGYNGSYAKMFSLKDENFGVINRQGKYIGSGYDELSINTGVYYGSNPFGGGYDSFENGEVYKNYFEGSYYNRVTMEEQESNIAAVARNYNQNTSTILLSSGYKNDKYSEVKGFVNGTAVVNDGKTNKLGLINTKGEEIIEVGKYDEFIQYRESNCVVAYKNGYAYLLDIYGNVLNDTTKYKTIGNYNAKFYAFSDLWNSKSEYLNRIFSNDIAISIDELNKFGLLKIEDNSADVNGDGIVDIVDLSNVANCYGKKKGQTGWNSNFDLKPDGIIDLYDLVGVAKRIK